MLRGGANICSGGCGRIAAPPLKPRLKTSLRDSGGHSARDRFVQYRHRVGNGMPLISFHYRKEDRRYRLSVKIHILLEEH